MWAIKDIGEILWAFGTFKTEEEAQGRIDDLTYFGDLLSPVQVDKINTEHANR